MFTSQYIILSTSSCFSKCVILLMSSGRDCSKWKVMFLFVIFIREQKEGGGKEQGDFFFIKVGWDISRIKYMRGEAIRNLRGFITEGGTGRQNISFQGESLESSKKLQTKIGKAIFVSNWRPKFGNFQTKSLNKSSSFFSRKATSKTVKK